MFGSATFARDRRKVATREGSLDGQHETAVWLEMVRHISINANLISQGLILPAHHVLTCEHRYDRSVLTRLCADSTLVPEGRAQLWGAGLALGLNGDYGLAVSILVPQLEQLVRVVLKRRGVHTLLVGEHGVESEKSLKAFLDMPEDAQALGAGTVMELKALLVEQSSVNLRNDIAHGLFDDANAWSLPAVYIWWFCLRLVMRPLCKAQDS